MRQSLLQLVRMQDYLDEEERQEREAKLKAEAEKIAKEKAEQEAAERKIAEAAAKEQRELEAAERLVEQVEAIEVTPPDAPASDVAEKQEKTPVTSPTQKRAEGATNPLLEGNNKDSPKTSLFDRLKTRVRALTGGDAENPEEPTPLPEEIEMPMSGPVESEETEKISPGPIHLMQRSESVPITREHTAPELR